MKPTSNAFHWFKFSQLPHLSLAAKSIIYQTMEKNRLKMEDIYFLKKAEFEQLFPMFGTPPFQDFTYSILEQQCNTALVEVLQRLVRREHLISLQNVNYPQTIKQRLGVFAPPVFFARGHLPLFNKRNITILGAEEINDAEKRICWQLGWYLAKQGFNVVSNHAWGTAENVHKAALSAEGTTTGLLANGINNFTFRTKSKLFGWQLNTLFASPYFPTKTTTPTQWNEHLLLNMAWSEAVIYVGCSSYLNVSHTTFIQAYRQLTEVASVPLYIPDFSLAAGSYSDLLPFLEMDAKTFSHPKDLIRKLR